MSAKSIRLSDCKGSELFWIKQIKMPFMRILHNWQGIYVDERQGMLVNLLARSNTSSQFLS